MKVVVDIPDEKFKWLCENNPNPDKKSIVGAIVTGTVLPKGHGDLIDRSKLVFYRCKENVMDCPPNYDFTCQNCEYGWTCKLNIDEAPTIIPADKGE